MTNKTFPTIAIIGTGNMGQSLLTGLLSKHYPAEKIWVTDPQPEKLSQVKLIAADLNTTSDNMQAISYADVIILAIKPLVLPTVVRELQPLIQSRKPLVISIAAGVPECNLQRWLGGNVAVVRVMPNTPAMIGCGATALFANSNVSAPERDIAESILSAVGITVWINDEKLMDAVTALSGSGPAYFFLVMEALQQAGERLGLTKEIARLLTLQTAYGAARMALESETSVVELRHQVTSPGGTTEAALRVLETQKLRDIFASALDAANHRAEEIALLLKKELES
jgi:pyrroline-5-carboxylate reductase